VSPFSLDQSKIHLVGLLVTVCVCFMTLMAPQTSHAKLSCYRMAEKAVLSIVITHGSFGVIERVKDRIRVVNSLGSPSTECDAGATVTNTRRVKIVLRDGGNAFIRLSRGAFAPGVAIASDPAPEIDFTISGSGYAEAIGGSGQDHFRYEISPVGSGVNLNANSDSDLDVMVTPETKFVDLLLVVSGGERADRIDALGAPPFLMYAAGGDGRDTLVAGKTHSILEGERGGDRIIGGRASDLIVPGQGRDEVFAGGGSDKVEVSSDSVRDQINCGSGRDRIFGVDQLDSSRSCG